MNDFKWEKSMSVGVEKLDRQHKVLTRLVNRIHEEVNNNDINIIVQSSIQLLIKYTKEHFIDEEELMILADYPHLEEHQHKHKILSEQVQKIASDLEQGSLIDASDLGIFLKNWLVDHIMQEDKKYCPYLVTVPH